MSQNLIVTTPFDGHAVGYRITDGAEVAAVLAGENAHAVVAVTAPDSLPAKPAPPAKD